MWRKNNNEFRNQDIIFLLEKDNMCTIITTNKYYAIYSFIYSFHTKRVSHLKIYYVKIAEQYKTS